MYWKWSTPCCTTPPTEEGHESGAPEAGHAQAHGRGGALETCGHAELVRRAEHLSDPTSSRPCLWLGTERSPAGYASWPAAWGEETNK